MSRYLITFDMDTNCLKDNYHGNSYNNAYADIKKHLWLNMDLKTFRAVFI